MKFTLLKLAFTIFAQLSLALSTFAANHSQSPIDFTPASTVYTPLPALNYSYSSSAGLHVYNNGSPSEESTIRADLNTTDSALSIQGISYTFKQFHFHTDSEHLLNGVGSPMELHMVHQLAGGSDLLVTGRWIVEGAENTLLTDIFSNFPTDTTGYNLADFNLNALLPSSLESYRYSGSLTTPDYTEPVQWIFLNTPLEMSAAQIQAFKTLFPNGNARDVQPLNGRTILTDVIPEPGSLTLCCVGAFIFLSRARRR